MKKLNNIINDINIQNILKGNVIRKVQRKISKKRHCQKF